MIAAHNIKSSVNIPKVISTDNCSSENIPTELEYNEIYSSP